MKALSKKTILITGGAGFIGANFAHKFLELGYNINLIDKQESDFWRIKDVKDKVNLCYLDLRNYSELESFILKLKPQIILHLAAYGAYQRKQQDIELALDTNLLGTINLVNACGKIKFDCFINTGSSSEYGEKEKPMEETELLEPNNLYGITKAASTMYCQHVARKQSLPIVTMRPFSVYGYFEEKERLMPTIIRSCLTNTELRLSSPDSVRDYIFIDDVIEAYLVVMKNIQKARGEVFNLGTGIQTTITEVVDLVKKITCSAVELKYGQIEPSQYESKNWVADISKIKKLLNWQPRYNLEQGLRKNIKWFERNISLYKYVRN